MRKLYLAAFSALFVGSAAYAQTIVSTSAQNRVAVLEEFTGIHCGYCPDGHKISSDLEGQYGDSYIAINIHAGSFANPGAGEPDLRTTVGEAIDDDAGVTGYPMGSVNRQNTPWAQSRNAWSGAVGSLTGQSSPLNVAVESSIDIATRVLTTTVEVYYTGNSSQPTNKLYVYLLQNNILGPQTDYGNYNPTNWIGDQYIHNHVLRMVLSDNGNSGEQIDSTHTGYFWTRTYTTTLPADVRGVPLELHNLEVVAFVADTKANIQSGHEADVALPPGVSTDLGVSSSTASNANYCDYKVTPEITVTNNSAKTITSFDIAYSVDGGNDVTESFSGSLGSGQSTTITWPEATIGEGVSTLSYGAATNINAGMLLDTNNLNNYADAETFYTVSEDPFDNEIDEGFEYSAGTTAPDDAYADNPGGLRMYVVDNSVNQNVNWDLGAHEESDASMRWDFASWPNGEGAAFYYDKIDMSEYGEAKLFFSYAYVNVNSSSDASLKVLASADCGANWLTIFNKSGDDLSTGRDEPSQRFYPEADDWTDIIVDLPFLVGEDEVIFKVEGHANANGGNSMYFDDLLVEGSPVSTEEIVKSSFIGVSPSPANDYINVRYDAKDVDLKVINALGQDVSAPLGMSEIDNGKRVDVSSLKDGVYFVQMTLDGEYHTERFMIAR